MTPLQQKIRDEFREKFSVMLERAGREHGESPEEWEEQIEAFLDKIPALVIEEVEKVLPEEKDIQNHFAGCNELCHYAGENSCRTEILQALSTLK